MSRKIRITKDLLARMEAKLIENRYKGIIVGDGFSRKELKALARHGHLEEKLMINKDTGSLRCLFLPISYSGPGITLAKMMKRIRV